MVASGRWRSLTAKSVGVDTTNFDGLLSTLDTKVQTALDTLDDMSGGSLPVDTSSFDGILSGSDDTIQKALDTIDDHGHDKISEGNSSIEVIDAGTGQIDLTVDGTDVGQLTAATQRIGISTDTYIELIPASNRFDFVAGALEPTYIGQNTSNFQIYMHEPGQGFQIRARDSIDDPVTMVTGDPDAGWLFEYNGDDAVRVGHYGMQYYRSSSSVQWFWQAIDNFQFLSTKHGGTLEFVLETLSAGTPLTLLTLDPDQGIKLTSGAWVNDIETSLTDDDTHLPTSGAVVDYVTGLGLGEPLSLYFSSAAKVTAIAEGVEVTDGTSTGQIYFDEDQLTIKNTASAGGLKIEAVGDGAIEFHANSGEVGRISDSGFALKTGATVDTIETTLTDDDTHLPTSGAVFTAVAGAVGNPLKIGQDDNLDGHLWLYGSIMSSGGSLRIYNAANVDSNVDYFRLAAGTGGDFTIGPVFGTSFRINESSGNKVSIFHSAGSTLVFGTTATGVDLLGLQLNTGQSVDTIETTLTDDDTHLPTSGAVFGAIAAVPTHTRLHAMTDVLDHSATNWRLFHSNGAGQVAEIVLGAANTVLISSGASAAPGFAQLAHSNLNLDDGTNPHSTTKSDVGLGNVPNVDATDADNISDGSTNAIITLTQETNFGTAYTHSQITTGNPHSLDSADIGAFPLTSASIRVTLVDQLAPYVSTNGTNVVMGRVIFPGTSNWKTPATIKANCWCNSPGTYDIKIYDATNALFIVSLLLQTNSGVTDIVDLGTLSNLPSGEAVFEIWMSAVGGGNNARIGSLKIQ